MPVAIFLALVFMVIRMEYGLGKGILRLAFYLPNVSSMVAVSVVWMILFLPSYGSGINQVLMTLGIDNPPRWLNATSTFAVNYNCSIWQRIGYNIIVVLAGLQGISKSLYEFMEIDGANGYSEIFLYK